MSRRRSYGDQAPEVIKPSGMLYQTDKDTVITVGLQNTYYDIDGMEIDDGLLVGFSFQNEKELVSNIDGILRGCWNLSFGNGANSTFQIGVMKNGFIVPMSENERTIASSSDIGAVSGNCFTRVSPGDILKMVIKNLTGDGNPTIKHACVVLN